MNSQKHKKLCKRGMNFFEYDAELSISTQAAMDYYDNFSKELERKSLDDQKVL